jgi:hypothetical protein
MLTDDIRELLSAPSPPDRQAFLERVDAKLTEGYARALQLEAERWRVEQRISEIIARLPEGVDRQETSELAGLAERRSTADEDLAVLRGLLGLLRERRTALRDAA